MCAVTGARVGRDRRHPQGVTQGTGATKSERRGRWFVHEVMLRLLLIAQLLVPAVPQDPTYATPALRDLVARAAERNDQVPPSLAAYHAEAESEIAVLARHADGEESAVSIEQARNDVRWTRPGDYEQQVTGYRARQAGPSLSALAVLRTAWTIPLLYGNRLSLFFGADSSSGILRDDVGDGAPLAPGETRALHPFARGRARAYRFSGGDTIAVLRTGQRDIAIVRILVDPLPADSPVVVFRGEIDLDAGRAEIVRMRGQFLTGAGDARRGLLSVRVMAYVDLESVEVDGRYWLPRSQRIEKHVDIGALAEGRTVFRIVTRFRNHVVTSTPASPMRVAPAADTPVLTTPQVHRLTVAAGADDGPAHAWWAPLGSSTAALRGDDFADLARTGASRPTWALQAQRLADVVHFNRVEGWSTGAAVVIVPGARAPGVTVRANAGWSWTQETVRGRVEAVRAPAAANREAGARLARMLDVTNDFTAPRDSGGSVLAALVGRDDYDYVDRTSAMAWIAWDLVPRRASLRVESGFAADRSALARLTRGVVRGDEPLGPNRGVDPGNYVGAAVSAEWEPAVNASPLATGVGARLRMELAAGQLAWQRSTLQLTARRETGPFAAAIRVDGGWLASRRPPPQQLFELGGGPVFPGFAYKEFAGDRALVTHARVNYRLPVLGAPLRIRHCTCLPAPAPALAVTLHAATLRASSPAALAAIARLGSGEDRVGYARVRVGAGTPLSRPTDGWQSSLEVGLTGFGGALTVGAARVLQPDRPWRLAVALGQPW